MTAISISGVHLKSSVVGKSVSLFLTRGRIEKSPPNPGFGLFVLSRVLGHIIQMRGFSLIILILFSISPAQAGGLVENSAFYFGFLSAQSERETDELGRRNQHIRSQFAKFGPKDSTDERGFDDWVIVGRETAYDRDDKRYATLLTDCRRLLERGRN